MGTWGTDLFADDEAADIRDTLMQELRRTQSEAAAMAAALELFQPETDDECGYLFWIVTASILWDYGRLTPELRDKALAAIDSGEDELRWESASETDRLDRKKTMAAIRTKLRSEVPPKRAIRRIRGIRCPWKVGDLVRMRGTNLKGMEVNYRDLTPYDGKYGVLHVVHIDSRPNIEDPTVQDHLPVIMLYDALWDTPPTVDDVIGTPAAWFEAYGKNCLFATGYKVSKLVRDYFDLSVIGHSDHFPPEASLWPNHWKKESDTWITVICDIAESQYDRDYGPPVDKIRAMHEEAVRRYEAYQKSLTKKPPASTC